MGLFDTQPMQGSFAGNAPYFDPNRPGMPPLDPRGMMSATPNAAGAPGGAMPAVQPQAPMLTPSISNAQLFQGLGLRDKLALAMHNPGAALSALGQGASHALDAAVDPNTAGMEGLLADGDLSHAHKMAMLRLGASLLDAGGPHVGEPAPTVGQALAHGLLDAQTAGRADLNATMQQRTGGLQIAQQRRILAARQAIGSMFQPQPNETPEQMQSRLAAMYSAYASVGDTEMMSKLGDLIKEMPQFKAHTLANRSLGNVDQLYDPYTGQVVSETPRGMSDDAKANAAVAHAIAQSGLDQRDASLRDSQDNRRFMQTDHLSQEYVTQVQPAQQAAHAYQQLQSLRAGALAGNPAASQAYLTAFIKFMHPTAVVRPGEALRYEDAATLPGRLVTAWQHYGATGAKIPPDVIRDMDRQAAGILANWREDVRAKQEIARQRAKPFNIDPSSYIFDPFDIGTGGSSGSGAGGGSGTSGSRQNPLLK